MATLGLGTAQFAGKYGISSGDSVVSPSACTAILEFAWERGIRYVDTAAAYGAAESAIGHFKNRDMLRIVSKCPPVDAERPTYAMEASLAHLRVPAIHGYLMHHVHSLRSSAQALRAWFDLDSDPRVEKVGLSLDRLADAEWVLNMNLRPKLVQVPMNPVDHRFRPFIAAAKQWGCEIHARSAYLQGLFFCDTESLPFFFDQLKPYIRDLQSRYRGTLPAALLRYSLRQAAVDVVFVGFTSPEQVAAACDARDQAGDAAPALDLELPEALLSPSLWPLQRSLT